MQLSENMPIIGPRNFTEEEIERITSNYSTLIGKGGFGEVYKGVLDDDDNYPVAVKRYIRGDLKEEFMEEVNIHSQIYHKNAVKLIGYCLGQSTLTMVSEYISQGNLDDTLHNSSISIPLDTRLGIAIGCAEALSYMHSMHVSMDSIVCHGDIKPANILLDDNLTAKISDFGLSRLLSGGVTRYTRNVKGSLDYMDPIYLREGRLTPKNDVYSFGAVLLELIARKRVKEGNISLIGTFSETCAKGKGLRELLDGEISEERNINILEEMGKLAIECLTLDIHKRPGMNGVTKRLMMLWKTLRGGEGNIGRQSFWKTQNKSDRGNGQGTSSSSSTSLVQHLFGIFQRKSGISEVPKELGNMRIFTRGELNEITENYSYILVKDWPHMVYKGTLEDNTLVAVRKSPQAEYWLNEQKFFDQVNIMSHIIHKNITKLLGCCIEDEHLIVFEYVSKGNLCDILHSSNDDFPLESRLNIAVKIAEALAYLHSSAAGVIHGLVHTSAIHVDSNFAPKLSVFFRSDKLTENGHIYSVIRDNYTVYTDPSYLLTGVPSVKSDVHGFGIVLLELISRKKNLYNESQRPLVNRFSEAYMIDGSGKEMFDKAITAQENTTVLEEIGMLGLKCASEYPDERPTMKEVAEHLDMLRRSWKMKSGAKGAQSCTSS